MKKKLLYTLYFFFVFTSPMVAQSSYCGKVVDNDGKNIAYANIVLMKALDSTYVTGTTSGVDGEFKIDSSAKGFLKISAIGYETTTVEVTKDTYTCIELKKESILLKEVTVTSLKPQTYIEGDAIVTTVKGTILEQLGTAKEVLGQIPGVISLQGGIEVFGKGTPLIYINGRIVHNFNLLDQMKPEKIKKVEVVTNPGARYKATTKSVIRIVTDKDFGEGFSAENILKLGYKDYLHFSNILNLTYRIRKLELFSNLEYDLIKQKGHSLNQQITWGSSKYVQSFNTFQKGRSTTYEGQLGFDYMFSKKHSVGAYYKITHMPFRKWSDINTKTLINDIEDDYSLLQHNNKEQGDTHLIDTYYMGVLGRWKLNAMFDLMWKNNHSSERNIETFNRIYSRNITMSDRVASRLIAGEIHASKQLWKGILNFGSEISNSSRDETFINLEEIINNNSITIKENNIAVYGELMQSLGKVMIQVGTRYEYVTSHYYSTGQKVNEQTKLYDRLFPSVLLNFPIKKTSWQLSYTKKYKRPVFSQLSNTVSYLNRYLYQTGNPLLCPSLIDDVSLNFKYNWLMFLINYTRTKDMIVSISSPFDGYNGATLMKKVNSEYTSHQLQTMVMLRPQIKNYYPSLLVGVIAPFYKEVYRGEVMCFNKPIFLVRMNNLYRFSSKWMFSADLNWKSKGNAENMEIGQSWQMNLGITKQINSHWIFNLLVNDMFNTARKGRFTLYSGVRETSIEKLVNTRSIECTLRYSFNKTKSKYNGKGAGNNEKGRL